MSIRVASCALAVLALLCATAAASPPPGFTVGALPPAPGLGLQRNADIEPEIAAAPDGALWVVAGDSFDKRRGTGGLIKPPESDPLADAGATDVWRSTDGGRGYRWVASPFNIVPGRPGPTDGADSDIAVATRRNATGSFNVYVASLSVVVVPGLASGYVGDVSLALSRDGGRHWLVDPYAATIPLDDRPWLAADGPCTLYMAHHALPSATLTIQKYDFCDPADLLAGATVDALDSTRIASFAPDLVLGKPGVYVLGDFGKIVADTASRSPLRHSVYVPATDCAPLTLREEVPRTGEEVQSCPGRTQVYVERSTDGGRHWTLLHAGESPNGKQPNWAITAAVDGAGSLYLTWFDDHNAYLISSRDGGHTWSSRAQLPTDPARTVAFPTIAAAGAGDIRISFYGTERDGDGTDFSVMGRSGAPGAAVWKLYTERSTDGGRTFSTPVALDTVHTGAVCNHGPGCELFSDARDLWDNFGATVDPITGDSAIAYMSDQPQGGFAHDFVGYATGL